MSLSSAPVVMAQALGRLEQLFQEAQWGRAGSINVFGVGASIDAALVGARSSIDFLAGEYRDRVLSPGSFSEGLTGELAWEGWRDLADSTGQQLARILGAVDKWDLSSTLATVSIATGQVIADGARGAVGGLPWVALGLAALAVLYVTKGGR